MTDEPRVADAIVPAAELGRTAAAGVWRWLLANLLAERDRWALWSPVLLGTGIAAYFALPVEPAPWLGAAGSGLAVVLLIACRHRPALVTAGLAALLVSGGFAAAQLRTVLVAAPMLTRDLDRVDVTGRIREVELPPKGQNNCLRLSYCNSEIIFGHSETEMSIGNRSGSRRRHFDPILGTCNRPVRSPNYIETGSG